MRKTSENIGLPKFGEYFRSHVEIEEISPLPPLVERPQLRSEKLFDTVGDNSGGTLKPGVLHFQGNRP